MKNNENFNDPNQKNRIENNQSNKNLKKWILPLLILLLTISSVVLVSINKIQTEERLAALGEDEVKVTVHGQEVARFNLETVKELPKIVINEGLNTSTGKEDVVFGGILLSEAFQSIGFDYTLYEQITYKAIDGYVSQGTVSELDSNMVYLVYERNGIQNLGKTQGGTGPMEIVITDQEFSLRNCKFLNEINFE